MKDVADKTISEEAQTTLAHIVVQIEEIEDKIAPLESHKSNLLQQASCLGCDLSEVFNVLDVRAKQREVSVKVSQIGEAYQKALRAVK